MSSRIVIQRPLAAVFPFFADAFNLDALTPPWLRFRIVTPPPIEMRVGARIDYALRVHGVPLRWQSEITVWDPPHRFVDVQRRGPYALWHHEHRFTEDGDGTLIEDLVHYRARGWILEPLIQRLLVGPDVRRIFAYRRRRIEEVFAPASAIRYKSRGDLSPAAPR